MKRFAAIILVCLLLVSMTAAAADGPGSASDPLATRGYVQGTFASSVKSEGETIINNRLNAVYESAAAGTGSGAAPSGPAGYFFADGFSRLSLSSRTTVTMITGGSFMLDSGSVTVKISAGTVIDVAAGTVVSSGSVLSTGRRYFCAEDTTAVFTSSGASQCLVDGWYKTGTAPSEPVVTPVPKTVVATTLKVKFNGANVTMEVYNIDGNTYYKLRDIAALMDGTASEFSVDFDMDTKQVSAFLPGDYLKVGGELAAGKDKSKSCVVSKWTLQVNGSPVNCYVYNLGNNNFFKLRDLGEALGFGVGYDNSARTVLITSADY